jgi:gluconokinase
MIIIVMGVTGCGKTTIGRLLAEHLAWEFFDADEYHPDVNVAKMSQGIPLNDEDRKPWLEALADLLSEQESRGRGTVLACSALKRTYRDVLRSGISSFKFIHLQGSKNLIASRLNARVGHYMDPELLDSQFKDLEPPSDSEAITVDVSRDAKGIAKMVLEKCQLCSAGM